MNPEQLQERFRRIPKVDELLKHPGLQKTGERYSRHIIVRAIRGVLEEIRIIIREEKTPADSEALFNPEVIIDKVKTSLIRDETYHFRHVINATGVVIHTNLGRSLLCEEALKHILDVARHYSNLEYNIQEGKRGIRYAHVEDLLCDLTGAEAALVVNNNAGAVLIALNSLAAQKEVIVSRGELIEIGGAFRIPDVMGWSGATLKEVGTTNKTHLYDYKNAIHEGTGLLMKVHTSNFRLIGFVEQVPEKELIELAHASGLPVMADLGSGNLMDFSQFNLPEEPTVQAVLKKGMDVVTFSGDKLLGGPQAGIILGKRDYIKKIQQNPLNRALRIDKLTLAALEATLKFYEDPFLAATRIPTLKMMTQRPEQLKRKAVILRRRLARSIPAFQFKVVSSFSKAGGGALPEEGLPTYCVMIFSETMSTTQLEKALRRADPPVIARIEKDRIFLDVRTLLKEDAGNLETILLKIAHEI
jgi:L-seryl-tRNA(Ser) seleniumtransferase